MNKKFAIVLALSLIAIVCCAGCIGTEDPVVEPVDPVDPVDPVTPPVDPVVPAEGYSVFFMLNYGEAGAYTAETVTAGNAVEKPANPTRNGYTFKGWFTAAEGGVEYDFTQAVNADLTLYAQWSKKSSSSSGGSSSGGSTAPSTPSESPDVVASIGDVTYTSLLEAINAAQDGDTINVRAKIIDEELSPWGGDSTHAIEKNITILGVNHDKNPSTWSGTETILTGGLYLGYDDSQTREHTITIKGITFQGNGLKIADQKDVVIENNKFTNIDGRAIAVLDQNKNGVEGSATITNNIIDTSSSVGIEVRNPHNVTITGNDIANTQENGIQLTGGVSGVAAINENKVKDWTTSGNEGRAIRVVLLGTGSVSVNENVFAYTGTPRESYVKITGNGVADVSGNYWDGAKPMENHAGGKPYYLADGRSVTTISEVKTYYKDEALTQLVDLAVAKIGSNSYYSLNDAITDAEPGATINVMPGVIEETISPWSSDTTHNTEKSITILGFNAENDPNGVNWDASQETILKGGMYLGYDDNHCSDTIITIQGLTFWNKGLVISGQENVVVKNNKFNGITEAVVTPGTASVNAISVTGQSYADMTATATISNNYIDNVKVSGINLRDSGAVTIKENVIKNVKHSSIIIQNGDTDSVVLITDNTMNVWGTENHDSNAGKDGRALRANFATDSTATVTFSRNTMINNNAPEEFVKITNAGSVKIGGDNNWNNVADVNPIYDTVPGTSYKYLSVDGQVQLGGTISVDTPDELATTLAIGGNVILTSDVSMESATTAPYGNKYGVALNGGVLDGNDNELEIECYGDDYGIMTSGGTVKNIVIEEGCRAIMIMYPTEDVILDNVKIGGDGVLYPINTGEAGADGVNLIVTNSVLAGWTSFSNIESASFTNVEFKQGTYYNNIYGRVLKPYVNTVLTGCSFIEHMNLDLTALTNGHKVTFKSCTVNGQAVTAEVFTVPHNNEDYDTALFTVGLPSWATTINDCIVFE